MMFLGLHDFVEWTPPKSKTLIYVFNSSCIYRMIALMAFSKKEDFQFVFWMVWMFCIFGLLIILGMDCDGEEKRRIVIGEIKQLFRRWLWRERSSRWIRQAILLQTVWKFQFSSIAAGMRRLVGLQITFRCLWISCEAVFDYTSSEREAVRWRSSSL